MSDSLKLSGSGRPMTAADVERLQANRVKLTVPDNDPRHIVERMRDEDNERFEVKPAPT